jgi:hypothetical protein
MMHALGGSAEHLGGVRPSCFTLSAARESGAVAVIDYLKTILTAQFEASLCMLGKCVRGCPPEHWEESIANGTFRQVAYHTLAFVDFYLSLSEEAFEQREVHRRGGSRRIGAGDGLPRDETIVYLAVCRRKAVETIAAETADSLKGFSGFGRLPFSRGELHLYNIRHVQHHTGQLSASLRRVGSDGPGWVKTGWRS